MPDKSEIERGWQPIETAPDCLSIELKFADGTAAWGDFDTDLHNPAIHNGRGMWCRETSSMGLGPLDAQPTHWRPHPYTPPSIQDQS